MFAEFFKHLFGKSKLTPTLTADELESFLRVRAAKLAKEIPGALTVSVLVYRSATRTDESGLNEVFMTVPNEKQLRALDGELFRYLIQRHNAFRSLLHSHPEHRSIPCSGENAEMLQVLQEIARLIHTQE